MLTSASSCGGRSATPVRPVDSEGRPKQVGEASEARAYPDRTRGSITVREHLHQRPTPFLLRRRKLDGLRACAAEMAEKQIAGSTSPIRNRTCVS